MGRSTPAGHLSTAWLALIGTQIVLGAATVWTGKSADIATLHMLTGALTLVVASVATAAVGRLATARSAATEIAARPSPPRSGLAPVPTTS
jgi:heme A synthase